MNIRLDHRVISNKRTHRFSVVVECPYQPHADFMFVFRDSEPGGDDCALIVEDIQGWDATNQHLLVRTFDWNVDEWAQSTRGDSVKMFDEAREQLIRVARCTYHSAK